MINFNNPYFSTLKKKTSAFGSQIAFFAILLILVDMLEYGKYSAVCALLSSVVVWMLRKQLLTFIKPKLYPVMKKITAFLELAYVAILSSFFYIYADNKFEGDEPELYTMLFVFTMLLILITEWVRRRKFDSNRPQFEKYLFIPAMFLVLLFGMYYVNSLADGY